jgi:hypothetical protein
VILRRDLAAARNERNISLAGDEDEQSRLVPKPREEGSSAKIAEIEALTLDETAGRTVGRTPVPGAQEDGASPEGEAAGAQAGAAPPAAGDLPQAPLSVFVSGYSPPGETIIGDISEGVTGLATVSPVSDLNVNVGERRLPVTERLYYKTLVKGEALKPKPGRADDFRWPRS